MAYGNDVVKHFLTATLHFMNFESKYYILHSTATNPSQVMHTELIATNDDGRTKTTIAGIPDLCVSRDPEFSSIVMFGEGKTRSDMDSGAHSYFLSELLRAVLQQWSTPVLSLGAIDS